MKKLILMLIMVSYMFSSNLNEIIYYKIEEGKELSEKDISEKIKKYKLLLEELKLDYNINEEFYNQEEGYKRKIFLEKRIKTNTSQGNILAITRDEIEINLLDLKYYILISLKDLKRNFKENKEIKNLLESYLKESEKNELKIDIYKEKLKEQTESSIYQESITNLNDLILVNKNYKELIGYLLNNYEIALKKETILELLKVEEIITNTNNIKEIKTINYYLNQFNTDVPRLMLSIIILFLFFGLNQLIKIRISPIIKNSIDKSEKEEIDVLKENFEKIKRPITYIVMLFGIEISLKVLVYPNNLNETFIGGINIGYTFFIMLLGLTITNIIFSTMFNTNSGKKYENKREFVSHGKKLLKIIIVIIAGLYSLKSVGYDISAFLASLGLMGMAIALAAKDTIANFFGSMVILSDRPFKIGDWVTLEDGTDGDIEEIGIRSTKIRTFARSLVSVPNAKIANASITNWSRMDKRRIKHSIGVTYNTSSEQMKNILKDIRNMLKEHKDIHQDTIHIYFEGFGSHELTIFCYYFTKTTAWGEFMAVREDTNLKIMEIIEKNKAEFAFPTQTLYLKKEDN